MRIQHNIAALNSHRNLTNNNSAIGKNLEKLSSGYRINRAGDDAAGLAISEKMRAQITGLETAQKNAQDGISLIQTAEGALTEVHSMLNRMVELAGQSANGTYQNAVDRENLQKEVNSLRDEIDRISQSTNFNGINLLDGSLGKTTGAPTKMVTTGTQLSNVVVTKASGSSINSTQTVTITTDDNKIKVQIDYFNPNDADDPKNGSSVTTVLDLNDVITITGSKDSKNIGKTLGELDGEKLGKGDSAVIDLSSVGLGRIEIADGGTGGDTAKELATALSNEIKGVGVDVPKDADSKGNGTGLTLQIGDTADDFNKLTVSVGNMSSQALGIGEISVADQDNASIAIDKIKAAINTVSSTRGDLGALQNRLEHTINNLGVTTENMTAAESRIRDVDMAKEMMAYTKNNILVQASQSMLAQANQLPQGVLQLLQ